VNTGNGAFGIFGISIWQAFSLNQFCGCETIAAFIGLNKDLLNVKHVKRFYFLHGDMCRICDPCGGMHER